MDRQATPQDQFTVILSHEHTDFDALASMLAAHKLHPHALPVLPRALNRNLRDFLSLYRSSLSFRRQEEVPRRRIDYVILVDTQSVSTIKGMKPSTPGQIIDHHSLQRPLEPGWTFWGEETGATTTLLVEKLAERHIPLSAVEATLLLLGIYEDTGSLLYAATTPRDLRAAAWLLERNANLQVVNRFLHHPLTEAQGELYAQLSEASRVHEIAGHSIVIAAARAPDFGDEISTLAHKLRDVYEPAGLFLLVDLGDRIQIVARSTSDAVNVGELAQKLGGGGHARAAAALVRNLTLPQVEEQLVHLLQGMVKPLVTVEQIMTHGSPTMVSPDTTIADMALIIQRYGFEGYPVLETGSDRINGKVVGNLKQLRGLITRRQVDRAQNHGLASHQVQDYMRTGRVSVTPQQSVATLQKIMIESGWGQIPVVDRETGRIIGIVTRTDLIKLWDEPQLPRSEEIGRRMQAALPQSLWALLHLAGESAEGLQFPLYAVGGFVRDLLLDRPTFDVDLVVEGDAIRLARKLAHRYGGRVRSHQRFGTAKWILPDTLEVLSLPGESSHTDNTLSLPMTGVQRASLPPSLDFVAARTEFYARPTALPTVEHSSIKQDLHRRDFTINTLAICLNPGQWGTLLDFYGGQRDLEEGLIRVLHTHSFVDDPTRILRAVRFEQRFGFRLEQRTAELIDGALDLLERVSPARVRHELELILFEQQPEQALGRLDELGITGYFHAALYTDDWVTSRFVALRAAMEAEQDPEILSQEWDLLYFSIWTYRLDRDQLAEIDRRLHLMRNTISLLDELHTLKAHREELSQPEIARSRIFHILHPASKTGRFLFRIIEDSDRIRTRIDLYQHELRNVRQHLNGRDLKEMGVTSGPIYRQLLNTARDAWLDGLISSEAQERDLVRRLVEDL